MENSRYVKISVIFLFLAVILALQPIFIFAYDDKTAHPALTDEIVDFFNLNFSEKSFNDKEKEIIKQGSIDEDEAPRWMRHYYDPVYERGLWGQLSSKKWAKATLDQAGFASVWLGSVADLFSATDDHSWERAIYEYAWGDKERGLKDLGHILHLIEDASVPDHTRNDPHIPYFDSLISEKSPYEDWTSRFHDKNIDVLSALKNDKPVIFSDLNDYFNSLASYSNNNFFSSDTIFDNNYSSPKISFEKEYFLNNKKSIFFGYWDINIQSPIVARFAKFGWQKINFNDYFLDDPDDIILKNYWFHLSKQAVSHGAGVIKLFFDEVDNEKATKILYNKNKTWAQRIFDSTKDGVFNIAAIFYGSSVTPTDLSDAEDFSLSRVDDIQKSLSGGASKPNLLVQPPNNDTVLADAPPLADEMHIERNEIDMAASSVQLPIKNDDNKNNAGIPGQFGLIAIPSGSSGAVGGGGTIVSLNETAASTATSTAPVDSTAPDLTFNIAECANSFFLSCLSTSTAAALVWSSSASDLASYELNCQTGGSACAGFPKIFSATSSVLTAETLSDFKTYAFTLKAADQAGNQTQITREIEIASLPVVINEIAWMGTASSSEDEWIELKNNSSQDISLNNWILRAEDNTPSIVLSGTIPAKGYFLLEKKDNLTVNDIAADLVYGNDGANWALNNSGEHLFLEYLQNGATTTIDEIANCANWCAGDNSAKKTMERYDSRASGASPSNWATALGEFILNSKDASGEAIKGTPKSRNSVSYQITNGSSLSSDKTLAKADSPYLIGRDGFTINSGAALTLEAGAVVKLVSANAPSLVVNGRIKAEGAENDPVVFTSFEDDAYGGDMNGDGICNPSDASSTAACPTLGSWKQILINSTSQNSSFTKTIIRYGGKWFSGDTFKAMVAVNNAGTNFDGVTVEYSDGHGLWLQNSASSVSGGSIFRNNAKSDSGLSPSKAAGIYIAGGSPTIAGNVFTDNRYGIYAASAPQGSISSNTFSNNSVAAIESDNNVALYSANNGAGNALNGIVLAGDISFNGTTTLKANPLPYIIKGEVKIMSGAALTFEPQTIIKGHAAFDNYDGKLTVKNGGKLFFVGASPENLIFTSLFDDAAGGNSDNATNTPAAGDWEGIFAESGGIVDLKGFTLRYAGGKISTSGTDKGGLRIQGGLLKIDSAVIENNFQNGIRVFSPSAPFLIKNAAIRGTIQKTSDIAAGIRVISASGALENMVFSGNEKDIYASSGYSIDMSACNCGSPSTEPNPL